MKNLRLISSPFLAPLVTVLSVLAGACTITYPSVRVGPSFHIRVSDRGRPVQGLRSKLVRYDSHASEKLDTIDAITDDRGQAHFNEVLPGSFALSADHDGGIADGLNVEVARDGPYQLVVRSPGFYPLQEMVHIQNSRASERCSRTLNVQLAVFGSCSSAELIPASVPEQPVVK